MNRHEMRYYHDVPVGTVLWPDSTPNVLILEQDYDEERRMYRSVIYTDDCTDHHRLWLMIQMSYQHIQKATP